MSKEVAVKADQVDLSGMSAEELVRLKDTLYDKISERRAVEAKEKLNKALDTNAVADLRAKVAKLEEEYKALPREIDMTVNVPVTFKLKVDLPDSLSEYLIGSNQFHDFNSAGSFIDGWGEFTGSVPKDAEGLTKLQRKYFNDGVKQLAEGACEESITIFEQKKEFEKVGKKVHKIMSEFNDMCNKAGVRISLRDVFEGE